MKSIHIIKALEHTIWGMILWWNDLRIKIKSSEIVWKEEYKVIK